MQVMVLAAGKSTRLGALGASLPKPLVPVCGYPPLAFVMAQLRAAGLRDVVINLHHHGDAIRATVGDGGRFGLSVRYSDEPEILGTGGALVKARSLFVSEPVLVVNGKVVADIDFARVIAAHRQSRRVATMVVRKMPRPGDFAPVLIDEAGHVVGLRGTRGPATVMGALTEVMFTGIAVIEGRLIDRLPIGVFSDVISAGYIPALLAGERIGAVVMDGYFEEHSTPAAYLQGNLALLAAPETLTVRPGSLVGVSPSAQIHPSARIVPPVQVGADVVVEADAVVGPFVVLGEGARVVARACIDHAVVWPKASVDVNVSRSVVTATGQVVVP